MRNLPGSIRTAETWLHAGLGTYPPSDTGGTREIDIPLPAGARARIVPRYAGVVDGNPVLRVYLEAGTMRQLLGEQIVDAIGGPATLARGPQMLQWAGDLDGDGKLDLVLNLSSRYDEDAEALLFLSSMARNGEMVGKAAGFSYWPVGNAGC
jgi:hypothetical protein